MRESASAVRESVLSGQRARIHRPLLQRYAACYHPTNRRSLSRNRMTWIQRHIELAPRARGFHLITQDVLKGVAELRTFETGLLHLFIRHTSASLSINENADSDVPLDLEDSLSAIA